MTEEFGTCRTCDEQHMPAHPEYDTCKQWERLPYNVKLVAAPAVQPSPASADARGWAERVDALYREYGQYVNVSMIAALLESFRAETLEQVRDYKLLKGIRDKILARLKNPAPHAAELREQALDLANDEYNKLRKNLGYPPLDNKGRWIFEAERAKLESGK